MNPPGHENAIIDNYVPIYRCGVSSKQLRTICIIKIFSGPENIRLESQRTWIFPRSCNGSAVQLISD